MEVREITPSQHFTEPPPRFSEASLVKELERLGIGRPSTYSAIISTLSAREYVRVDQRRFFPTELGETVEKIMVGKFPEIFNVEFTSDMEDELDRIEDGELEWQRVLQDFYGPFTKALDAVDMKALVANAHGLKPEELAKERCPKCGSPIELRTGRFGPYLACAQVQGHLRLREVAEEGEGARPAERREMPSLRLGHGHQDRPVRRVPGLHHVSQVQGYPLHSHGPQVPQVSRRAISPSGAPSGASRSGDACAIRSVTSPPGTGRCRRPVPVCGWLGMEKRINKAEGETRKCLKCGHRFVVAKPEEVALA